MHARRYTDDRDDDRVAIWWDWEATELKKLAKLCDAEKLTQHILRLDTSARVGKERPKAAAAGGGVDPAVGDSNGGSLYVAGRGGVRVLVGPCTLTTTIRVWVHGFADWEMMDPSEMGAKTVLALTKATDVERVTSMKAMKFEVHMLIVKFPVTEARVVRAAVRGQNELAKQGPRTISEEKSGDVITEDFFLTSTAKLATSIWEDMTGSEAGSGGSGAGVAELRAYLATVEQAREEREAEREDREASREDKLAKLREETEAALASRATAEAKLKVEVQAAVRAARMASSSVASTNDQVAQVSNDMALLAAHTSKTVSETSESLRTLVDGVRLAINAQVDAVATDVTAVRKELRAVVESADPECALGGLDPGGGGRNGHEPRLTIPTPLCMQVSLLIATAAFDSSEETPSAEGPGGSDRGQRDDGAATESVWEARGMHRELGVTFAAARRGRRRK